MRYGNDYGNEHWWGRAVRGDAAQGWMRGGVGHGHGLGGGDFDAYSSRDASIVRGGFTGDAARGYAGDPRGMERTGRTGRGPMGRDEHADRGGTGQGMGGGWTRGRGGYDRGW